MIDDESYEEIFKNNYISHNLNSIDILSDKIRVILNHIEIVDVFI